MCAVRFERTVSDRDGATPLEGFENLGEFVCVKLCLCACMRASKGEIMLPSVHACMHAKEKEGLWDGEMGVEGSRREKEGRACRKFVLRKPCKAESIEGVRRWRSGERGVLKGLS